MYLNDIVSENQTRRQAAAKQMVKSNCVKEQAEADLNLFLYQTQIMV